MRDTMIEGEGVWLNRLRRLVGSEREMLVEMLLLLGRVDHSRLYLSLGYASAWDFVRRGLGQSERMTFYRLAASRVLFRFSHAVELLRSGSLCMTTLATLGSVLTDDNARAVLDEAVGKDKGEIAAIKARLAPRPLPKDVVRTLAVRDEREAGADRSEALTPRKVAAGDGDETNPARCEGNDNEVDTGGHAYSLTPEPVASENTVSALLEPIATDQAGGSSADGTHNEVMTTTWTRRHMNTDSEFEHLLARLRMSYSHKMPGASEMDLLKAAMRRALVEHEKRKGVVERPRLPKLEQPPRGGNQAISAHVKREVWLRDQGRCQWPINNGDSGNSGSVCGSTLRVEFHHMLDRGKGGLHTSENLVLACGIHNGYAADSVWGKQHMDQYRTKRRPAPSGGSERRPTSSETNQMRC